MKLQAQWGLIQTHTSSGCPFADARPWAPHGSCQCPTSLSQICTLLPIPLKTAEVLTANPVLSKWSPFAESPVQAQWLSRGRRCRGAAAKLPEQQCHGWSTSLPRAWHPRACRDQGCPTGLCHPGARGELPSLAPLCPRLHGGVLLDTSVPLANICTLDKMLLFLSLLISSSSFNCSLEAFFRLPLFYPFPEEFSCLCNLQAFL